MEWKPRVTFGMAVYHDAIGVWNTIQHARLVERELDAAGQIEWLVVDNLPDSSHGQKTRNFVEGWPRARVNGQEIATGRYIPMGEKTGTAAPRDRVFREAKGEIVVCVDSHVLIEPGCLTKLLAWFDERPDCADLVQGPMLYDNLFPDGVSTHMEPTWRSEMWGIWGADPRGLDPAAEAFEMPMHGLGLFGCRKAAWLGFHPDFRGFGAEEGYIHEKFRQAGRKCWCLPFLRWLHNFGSRPDGVPYPLTTNDKLRNYLIGHSELGLPVGPILQEFAPRLPADQIGAAIADVFKPKAA